MPNGEYQELIGFLGRQFTAIDNRFDALERRLDAHDEKFREVLGHFDQLHRRLERLENITPSFKPFSGSKPSCLMRRRGGSSWSGA